jgi:hypothetical protein
MGWAAWLELHPETLILDKGRGFTCDVYSSYYSGPDSGIIGRAIRDERLPSKQFVVGLQLIGAEKAHPNRELSQQPLLNDSVAGRDIVVTFAVAATGAVWDRAVGAGTLIFHKHSVAGETLMTDEETGSIWAMRTGRALSGPLADEALKQIPTTPSFWFIWLDLFPMTELFGTPVE